MSVTRLWSTHPDDVGRLDGETLRGRFVLSGLFTTGEASWGYAHDDRMLVGGLVVDGREVALTAPEEIKAAENQVKQAEAALDEARWRLSKRTLSAPSAGRVDDVIRNPGDTAGPSAPVLSILPDGAVKLTLFIPETAFSSVKVGSEISVRCDGCRPDIRARVSYVSPDPEFTPPVIYSLENRQKLVYLVEAKPEGDAGPLQPGQIVDVELAGDGNKAVGE